MQISNSTGYTLGGTGLGLSIVKGLVELLGGQIEVESKVGEGSQFVFSIKYESAPRILTNENPGEASGLSLFRNKSLLLVEDDLFSATFIMELLSEFGFIMHHEVAGPNAVQYVKNNHVDLVLLDIRIPELDGYGVARELKKQFPEIKIIAQTACAMAEDRNKAIEAGCDDYISKPVEKKLLMQAIQMQLTD